MYHTWLSFALLKYNPQRVGFEKGIWWRTKGAKASPQCKLLLHVRINGTAMFECTGQVLTRSGSRALTLVP
jgi:hypothetical protein